jgi:putative nucleotidyltransferase with HDIG domain
VLEAIIPEICPMKGCRQNDHHHLDVWGHSLAVLENLEQILTGRVACFGDQATAAIENNLAAPHRLAVLKLAALLHDVGKPGARSVDPDDGKVVFLGHDAAGAETAAMIAERLKLSGPDRDLLVLLVANHMHALFWSEPRVKPKTILKWCRRLGEDIIPLILLSMADTLATRGPAADEDARRRHIRWADETVRDYYAVLRPKIQAKPLVTGKDLIALGMKPGPEMGRVLEMLRQAQDAGEIEDGKEALKLAERAAKNEFTGAGGPLNATK